MCRAPQGEECLMYHSRRLACIIDLTRTLARLAASDCSFLNFNSDVSRAFSATRRWVVAFAARNSWHSRSRKELCCCMALVDSRACDYALVSRTTEKPECSPANVHLLSTLKQRARFPGRRLLAVSAGMHQARYLQVTQEPRDALQTHSF